MERNLSAIGMKWVKTTIEPPYAISHNTTFREQIELG